MPDGLVLIEGDIYTVRDGILLPGPAAPPPPPTAGERISARFRARPPLPANRSDIEVWGRYEVNLVAKVGIMEDIERRNALIRRARKGGLSSSDSRRRPSNGGSRPRHSSDAAGAR